LLQVLCGCEARTGEADWLAAGLDSRQTDSRQQLVGSRQQATSNRRQPACSQKRHHETIEGLASTSRQPEAVPARSTDREPTTHGPQNYRETSRVRRRPNQVKPSQVKSSQVRPSQVKRRTAHKVAGRRVAADDGEVWHREHVVAVEGDPASHAHRLAPRDLCQVGECGAVGWDEDGMRMGGGKGFWLLAFW
jgi:hypothetical protein